MGNLPANGNLPILIIVADDLGYNDVSWHNPYTKVDLPLHNMLRQDLNKK